MRVQPIPAAHAEDAIDVLADAFVDYPVMRYILGDAAGADREEVRRLVRFFVLARALSGHPVLGARDEGELVGVATVSPPDRGDPPEELETVRAETWAALGEEARARYEAFGRTAGQFTVDAPHHHLHMVGVPPAHQGRGIARGLLDAVHDLAEADPASAGVSLSTEAPANVALYQHFGYRLLGDADVGPGLHTWVFFRARPVSRPA